MADQLVSNICVLILIAFCNVPGVIAGDAKIPTSCDVAMMQLGVTVENSVSLAACPRYSYETQLPGVCRDKDGLIPRFYEKELLDTDPQSCKNVCSCEPDCEALYENPLGDSEFYNCVIFGPNVAPEGFQLTVPDVEGTLPINTSHPAPGTCFIRGSEVVSSIGDPHLVNLRGEHFDIYEEGKFVLLELPRRAERASPLLLIEANSTVLGDPCLVYFQVVTISGNWTNQTEPILFLADPHGKPGTIHGAPWMRFGPAEVKVVHRRRGVDFLDIFVRNLGRTGHTVGGLLGSDSHDELGRRPRQCASHRLGAPGGESSVAAALLGES